jgi:DNA-binding MurR/RpiR family transcriptional regulator
VTATLSDRIRSSYPALSPQEQRAADFLRDHLADLAVYNATEVAKLSGVSKATISRLYRRLGFESADELREHVRGLRASGTPIPSATPASFADHLTREAENLRAALADLDLAPAARIIADARRVVVVGFRNSYPMALHLRQQLAQARDDVELAPLPGQSMGEELAGLASGDAVMLVGFRRRPELFGRILGVVADSGAASVLLIDPSGRRHAAFADVAIEVPVDSVTSFDSYAAAASVISLLASAVLAQGLAAGRERIGRIGALYGSLHELES